MEGNLDRIGVLRTRWCFEFEDFGGVLWMER